jgi:hypothetical protein
MNKIHLAKMRNFCLDISERLIIIESLAQQHLGRYWGWSDSGMNRHKKLAFMAYIVPFLFVAPISSSKSLGIRPDAFLCFSPVGHAGHGS